MYFCTANVNGRVMICTLCSAHWYQTLKRSTLRQFELIGKIEESAPINYAYYYSNNNNNTTTTNTTNSNNSNKSSNNNNNNNNNTNINDNDNNNDD